MFLYLCCWVIQGQSESPCLNNVNFAWESLVMQKVKKQIKSEVGADCCTELNGIRGPRGPPHPLSVFLLHFQWKWTALRFPTGDYRPGLCVFEGEERRRVWTQPHKKRPHTQICAHQLFQVNEHWNIWLLFPPSLPPYGDLCRKIIGAEETRSRTTGEKREEKKEHFLKVHYTIFSTLI